jgi:hypothetical protein
MGKLTGITSFPIPSAGMRPILSVCLAAMEKGLKGTLNMAGVVSNGRLEGEKNQKRIGHDFEL